MATCRDCLHQCYISDLTSDEETCNFFLDKNKYIEQKHGKWIVHFDDLWPEDSTQECSICHEEEFLSLLNDNYCPNCGAKMDL